MLRHAYAKTRPLELRCSGSIFPGRRPVPPGSVAAIKAPLLHELLERIGEVRVVVTGPAARFLPPDWLQRHSSCVFQVGSLPVTGQELVNHAAWGSSRMVRKGDARALFCSACPALMCSHTHRPARVPCLCCLAVHLQDADEWSSWRAVGDPVVHIELRRWAQVGQQALLQCPVMPA